MATDWSSFPEVCSAQIVVPCCDLAEALVFFCDRLKFSVDMIMPADAPAVAVVSGYGVCLRLVEVASTAPVPVVLRLECAGAKETVIDFAMSDAIRIEWIDTRAPIALDDGPTPFVVTRSAGADSWSTGRAGMRYRDLIPGRLGGRFIASQIRIIDAGPVPDYVHFHDIRFQMIYCKAGSIRVAYEDQGEPFVLYAGDCVLQPPLIRHRVLEASAGTEVIEMGCPAVHPTFADHVMTLPNPSVNPPRHFGSQRFVRHVAANANWAPWRLPGFEGRDSGIAAATEGLAGVRVVRPLDRSAGANRSAPAWAPAYDGELLFLFVLQGTLTLDFDAIGAQTLVADDCCVIPTGHAYAMAGTADLEMLEVSLPA